MNAPKSLTERNAALVAEISKIERARDTACRDLEKQLNTERAKAGTAVRQLRQAERLETERLAAEIAKDETAQLQPIVNRVVEAAGALTRDDAEELCVVYQRLNRRSVDLFGVSLFERTERLLWCLAEATVCGPEILAESTAFTRGPDLNLHPWQREALKRGELDEATGYVSLPGVHGFALNRPYEALCDALGKQEWHRVARLVVEISGAIHAAYSAAPNEYSTVAAKKIEAMRHGGLPSVVMRQLRELHEIESAPAAAEQARLSEKHTLGYSLQQRLYNGAVTLRDALGQWQSRFGSDPAPSFRDPIGAVQIATGEASMPHFRPDGDSLRLQVEIDTTTGARTGMGDDAVPEPTPIGPDGSADNWPKDLIAKDGVTRVTHWIEI